MKLTVLVPLLAAIMLAAIVLVANIWSGGDQSARAGDTTIVGFDMNPSGNSATAVGTID